MCLESIVGEAVRRRRLCIRIRRRLKASTSRLAWNREPSRYVRVSEVEMDVLPKDGPDWPSRSRSARRRSRRAAGGERVKSQRGTSASTKVLR